MIPDAPALPADWEGWLPRAEVERRARRAAREGSKPKATKWAMGSKTAKAAAAAAAAADDGDGDGDGGVAMDLFTALRAKDPKKRLKKAGERKMGEQQLERKFDAANAKGDVMAEIRSGAYTHTHTHTHTYIWAARLQLAAVDRL